MPSFVKSLPLLDPGPLRRTFGILFILCIFWKSLNQPCCFCFVPFRDVAQPYSLLFLQSLILLYTFHVCFKNFARVMKLLPAEAKTMLRSHRAAGESEYENIPQIKLKVKVANIMIFH